MLLTTPGIRAMLQDTPSYCRSCICPSISFHTQLTYDVLLIVFFSCRRRLSHRRLPPETQTGNQQQLRA